jgi:hypothetical protein
LQAIQHGKVPFRGETTRTQQRQEPLGKGVPDRNRVGDAINHLPYFIRFGSPRISMGT